MSATNGADAHGAPNGAPNGAPKPQAGFKATERIQAGPGPGRGPMGGGMVGQKAMTFGPSAKRLRGPDAARAGACHLVVAAGRGQRRPDVDRAADPRACDRPGVLRSVQPQPARGRDPGAGGAGPPRAGRGPAGRTCSPRWTTWSRARVSTSARSATCCCSCSRSTSRPRCSGGCRASSSTASSRTPSTGCARTSRTRSTGCPLGYFDRSPRGELLSRVTNDIDNVSQTLQQTMSQLLTSLMTVIAVLAMMIWISPLLAVIALVSVPVSHASSPGRS